MLSNNHKQKISELRQKTYSVIVEKMPEWRQNKWHNFVKLYEEKISKGIKNIDLLDFALFVETMNADLNDKRSMRKEYERAKQGLFWIGECTKLHDNIEKYLLNLPEDEVLNFDVNSILYPQFPLEDVF